MDDYDSNRCDSAAALSISPDGSTLTLNGAQTSDSGKYTCVASNPAGEEDRIFNLNVYGEFDHDGSRK